MQVAKHGASIRYYQRHLQSQILPSHKTILRMIDPSTTEQIAFDKNPLVQSQEHNFGRSRYDTDWIRVSNEVNPLHPIRHNEEYIPLHGLLMLQLRRLD